MRTRRVIRFTWSCPGLFTSWILCANLSMESFIQARSLVISVYFLTNPVSSVTPTTPSTSSSLFNALPSIRRCSWEYAESIHYPLRSYSIEHTKGKRSLKSIEQSAYLQSWKVSYASMVSFKKLHPKRPCQNESNSLSFTMLGRNFMNAYIISFNCSW